MDETGIEIAGTGTDITGSFAAVHDNAPKHDKATSSWMKNLPELPMLGTLLVEEGKIDREQLKTSLAMSKEKKIRLGKALETIGAMSEGAILETLGKHARMKTIPALDVKWLDRNEFDYAFFSRFDIETLNRLDILPLKLDIEHVPGRSAMMWNFHFITADPWQYPDARRLAESYASDERGRVQHAGLFPGGTRNEVLDEDVRIEMTGILAKRDDIHNVLGELEGRNAAMSRFSGDEGDSEEAVAKTLREILSGAIQKGVTDVHISPLHKSGGLWVRYRKDGELNDVIRNGRYSEREYNMFLNRCMTIAKMNQTEKRHPQSGSLQFSYNKVLYDMRVEVMPTSLNSQSTGDAEGLDGSKILFRILYKDTGHDITTLGISDNDLALMRKIYTKPSGVMLVTGPTSCGKTTTIYSIIKALDATKQSIYTVEDPVEYHLEGATQIPVQEREGRSFAIILKSMMRLDPNIVFMGEMRDTESAVTAMQVANTGHTVFSTLHTNSAFTAPQRLNSMGVEPYLIIGNLNGVIAQRLVRANCTRCLEEYVPSEKTIKILGLDPDRTYWHGSGRYNGGKCPVCGGLGTKGRIGIFEILPLCEHEGWEEFFDKPLKLRKFFKDLGYDDLMDNAKKRMEERVVSPDSLLGVLARMETVIGENDFSEGDEEYDKFRALEDEKGDV